MDRPEWIDTYFCVRQGFAIICVILCYTFSLLSFLKICWIFIFYLVFGMIVVIESLISLYCLLKIMRIMNEIRSYPENETNDMKNAKFWIKFACCLAIGICLVGVAMVILCAQCVFLFISPMHYDESLVKNIFHSGLIIVIVGTLITWIYEKNTCCTVMDGSICDVYCFGECYAYHCRRCCRSDIQFEEFVPVANKKPFKEVSPDTSSKRKSLLLNDSRDAKKYSAKYNRRRRKTITSFTDSDVLSSPLSVPELGITNSVSNPNT